MSSRLKLFDYFIDYGISRLNIKLLCNCDDWLIDRATTELKTTRPSVHRLWSIMCLGFIRPGYLDLWPI